MCHDQYQKAYIELKKTRPTAPQLPSPTPRRPQFHPRTQSLSRPLANPAGNMINPRPPSFAAVGANSYHPTSFKPAAGRAPSYPPTSFTPTTGGMAPVTASSAHTHNQPKPFPAQMLNFHKPPPPPMVVSGNTAPGQSGFHPGDTFAPPAFKKPRTMPPPTAGINLNMSRSLPKPPMRSPANAPEPVTRKHIPGGAAVPPSLADPITDVVPQIPMINNASPAEFDPPVGPAQMEAGNALAASVIPAGENPLAASVIPAGDNLLAAPVIPAEENPLAAPVIPAEENPLATPVIPAGGNALSAPVAPADTPADTQTQLQTPKIPTHTPPAATSEAATATMEGDAMAGENVPTKPLLPKAFSLEFPGEMDAFSPFDSTPTAVPAATDINAQMAERESKTPTADTPAFEFPNSPGTSGNFTPVPYEPFNFDMGAEINFALAGSATTPRDTEEPDFDAASSSASLAIAPPPSTALL